jgi:hypothetical protein
LRPFARRGLALLLGVGLATVAVLSLPKLQLAWQARQHRTAEAQQVAILRAVFDPEDDLGGPGRPNAGYENQVLINHSIELQECDSDRASKCVDTRSSATGIPLDLRLALIRANSIPQAMPDPEVAHVSLKSEFEATSPFTRGADLDRAWQDFRARHGARAFWRVSRAVVSADGTQALIYAEVHCGGLCGRGDLILLSRSNGEWTLSKSHRVWIS